MVKMANALKPDQWSKITEAAVGRETGKVVESGLVIDLMDTAQSLDIEIVDGNDDSDLELDDGDMDNEAKTVDFPNSGSDVNMQDDSD